MEVYSDAKMNKADFIQSFKKTDIRKEYKFMKKIGFGKSGVYYKARHKVSEDLFCVKAVAKKKCANTNELDGEKYRYWKNFTRKSKI